MPYGGFVGDGQDENNEECVDKVCHAVLKQLCLQKVGNSSACTYCLTWKTRNVEGETPLRPFTPRDTAPTDPQLRRTSFMRIDIVPTELQEEEPAMYTHRRTSFIRIDIVPKELQEEPAMHASEIPLVRSSQNLRRRHTQSLLQQVQ
jgi:hypothetical protein